MKERIMYVIAYINLIIVWLIFFLIILELFDIINGLGQISLLAIPFGYIYHKYKPMAFKEVIFKFIGIKLPTWETIKYKFMILIGTDSTYLKREKDDDIQETGYLTNKYKT